MIILDTNVLSALMQQPSDSVVLNWLDRQAAESIWVTTITVFEARFGIALLPNGQRKSVLQEQFEELIQTDLANRVLTFDRRAAQQAAQWSAARRARGLIVDMRDTFIAGIALAQSATLATRNIRHFDDLATPVINPWAAAH